MNKVFYTWEDFDSDVKSIVEYIKQEEWDIKQVYAIPKGGLILGVVLSNTLGCELITRLDERKHSYNNVLVVDDISDSGKTLLNIPKIFLYNTVTLFLKEGSQFVPNRVCRDCKRDDWVSFCWEPKDKEMKRDNDG